MSSVTLLQKWQLLHAIVADQELSPSAKLVAVRLLYHHSALTGRCSPSYQTLAEGIAVTRRSVILAVRELEDHEWLSVQRVRGGDPSAARGFVTNSFALAFERLGALPPAEDGVKESTLPPSEENYTRGGEEIDTPPGEEKGTRGVKESTLPGVKKTTLNSGKDSGKGNREVSPPTPSRFDEFWEAYPRKAGRYEAHRLFFQIITAGKATAEDLIAGAVRYANEREGESARFTKHPKTWLNGGHWTDEPAPPATGMNGGHPHASGNPSRGFSGVAWALRRDHNE